MKRSVQEYYIELCEQLSVRAKNVLRTNKLDECSVFIENASKPYFSFMNLRNAGKKTAEELDSLLKKLMSFQLEETDDESISITEDEQTRIEISRRINTPIVEYNLSTRSLNCLKKVGINTLGDLVTFDRDTILKIRSLGKSSFLEIEYVVFSEGFHWGMDISKYCIDDPEIQFVDSKFNFLSRIDKDYVLSFKKRNGHFPMVFLLYKALDILTDCEREVLKLSWGIMSPSILPSYNTIHDISKWNEETINPMSLEEIANSFCLTRERIRQIFDKANERLNTSNLIKQLSQCEDWKSYDNSISQPFLFFSDLTFEKAIIEKVFIVEYIKEHSTSNWINEFIAGVPCISVNLCCFIIRLRGMVPYWVDLDKKELYPRYNSKEATPFLFVNSQLSEYNYSRAVKEAFRLQGVRKTGNVVIPIISYFIENEIYWNRKCKPTEIDQENILQLLIRLVQTLFDVQIEGKTFLFTANRIDYGDWAYEILKSEGKRMHRDELFKRLIDLSLEKGLICNIIDSSQMTTFLTKDLRIVPVGKSGFWGLKEWGKTYGSIRELSIRIVKKQKRPIHIDELMKLVLELRPDSNEKSVYSVIRQTASNGELLLFYNDYIGYPKASYVDDYILMPRTFDEWLVALKVFVIMNKRYPISNQEYEGYLYRWHYRSSQLTELSAEEIIKFDALEKELSHYPHNTIEYNFLHNCDLYKKFVEGNNRMLTESDDRELFKWFYSASREYSTYNDNRNKYFSNLLKYLSQVLF